MMYKAENIDTDKFLEHLDCLEKFDNENQRAEKIATEKYHEGYKKALDTVRDMFYCCNYEKKESENSK